MACKNYVIFSHEQDNIFYQPLIKKRGIGILMASDKNDLFQFIIGDGIPPAAISSGCTPPQAFPLMARLAVPKQI